MAMMSAKNETAMEQVPESIKTQSKGLQWTGRVFTGLTVLFMLFDAVGKFAKPTQVTEAFVRLGLPIATATSIGILLLVSTLIYAIPGQPCWGLCC